MSQPGPGAPLHEAHDIGIDDDAFIVDVAVLAQLLQVPASDVQALMRDGRITSLSEKGVGEDIDQFRLTFFYGTRRASIRIDRAGRILARSVIDFGSEAASRAIGDRRCRQSRPADT